WLLAEAARQRWYGSGGRASSLFRAGALLGAAAGSVVGAVLALAVVGAGLRPVWDALVIFPLFNYRSQMSCPGGAVNRMPAAIARFRFPLVLKSLPLALLPSAARLLILVPLRRDPLVARRLLLLLIFSGASALSIAYFPDFIKISFIASVFLVAAAENLEWAVGTIPAPEALKAPLGWLAFIIALVAGGRQLYANLVALPAAYPVRHTTAFGRVDFASEDEARLRDTLAALLADQPSRALY